MTVVYCYDPLFLEHDEAGHPENRARLEHIWQRLTQEGITARMVPVAAKPVEYSLLSRIHTPRHIASVRALAERGGGYILPDTYVARRSYDVALAAAGGTVEVVRAVLEGRAGSGIALVRPPGHHATPDLAKGFCLFNNIALGAQCALDDFGVSRVLVIDWDVHHGNGTQDIFYESPHVLYFSTHEYPLFPGTGHWQESGEADGKGFTVNVPLPSGAGDQAFASIYADLLAPLARRFRPELILVSAGYDAHWKDPLASLQMSLAGFWRMAQEVRDLAGELCEGRLVAVLEGGYNLEVLACGVADLCRILLGDEASSADPLGPCPWRERSLGNLLQILREFHGLEATGR